MVHDIKHRSWPRVCGVLNALFYLHSVLREWNSSSFYTDISLNKATPSETKVEILRPTSMIGPGAVLTAAFSTVSQWSERSPSVSSISQKSMVNVVKTGVFEPQLQWLARVCPAVIEDLVQALFTPFRQKTNNMKTVLSTADEVLYVYPSLVDAIQVLYTQLLFIQSYTTTCILDHITSGVCDKID